MSPLRARRAHTKPVAAALASALLVSAACSAGGGASTSASTGGSSSGGTSSGGPGSSGGTNPECVGTSVSAERQPLDLYVMLDRSGSMKDNRTGTTTRWQAVTAALSSFVAQPLDGTSIGLQYFALGGVSCNAADYAVPEVEIGPLADTGPRIRASMAAQDPSTDTPTSAALQGAIDHARAWGADAAHAGHLVAVVLATDGEPNRCDADLGHIDAIAAAGLAGTPGVRTFVVGVGPSLSNLNGIAKAGGTDAAYLVDTSADATDELLQALNDIRGKATAGCGYLIPSPPDGQRLDYDLVNVQYRPGGGRTAITLGKVADAAACGSNARAWHYDRAGTPTSIVLCPGTCSVVDGDAAASVAIVLGCISQGEW